MKLFAFIIIVVLVDFFCSSEAFWPRRYRRSRRRRCHPPSTTHGSWINHWGQSFIFTCPDGKAMTDMHSIYSNCRDNHDRVFRFACGTNKATSYREKCHWSHWVNDFNQLVSYKCPYSGFLAGIRSEHSNTHQDRRFMFRCCSHQLYHRYHCTTGSHFVNDWKQPLRFGTPWKYFLVGVTSYRDNSRRVQDRRWKFEYCKVKKY